MKRTILIILLISLVGLFSCEKTNYSTLNGKWYGLAESWHVDFSGKSFVGEAKGYQFSGTYTIDRKKINFKFSQEAPVELKGFYGYLNRVKTFNIGKTQLNLHGLNFQIRLTR